MTQRHFLETSLSFVTTNVFERSFVFDEKEKAERLAGIIIGSCALKYFNLVAFCILPDHFHLLVRNRIENRGLERPRYSISNLMQSIKGTYSRDVHWGRFWQRGFYLRNVISNKQLFTTISYIRNNYKKADLPEKFASFPYLMICESGLSRPRI